MRKKYYLHSNWKVKPDNIPYDYSEYEFTDMLDAIVPGEIYTDLMRAGKIDDPYYADNEKKSNWVAESDWVYSVTFDKPEETDKANNLFLVFEGIDTIAEITFNGKHLGFTENMFLKYEYEVSGIIQSKNNILRVVFRSPLRWTKEKRKDYDARDKEIIEDRVFIRKAQYSFGWDWGPSLPTMGIWRPVYLERREGAVIEDVHFNTENIEDNRAAVSVSFSIQGDRNEEDTIKVYISNDEQVFAKEIFCGKKKDHLIRFEVENPALWYPNGYGEQNLYDLKIEILSNNNLIDKYEKKVGLRTIELSLLKGEEKDFAFIVNDKRIFIKGVNWIPGDSFLPRVSGEKYSALLNMAKSANINMVRVWGGGIYENDIFYDLCDELGLLVWQDFMFACATYPEMEDFNENIRKEFEYNIKRLRIHPSIAVWCGNNEIEWMWYQRFNLSGKNMPSHEIFDKIIPNVLKRLDPKRPYWQSSPFGFDDDPNSQNSGSTHQWNIWSGWNDYNDVVEDNSLFVTEFGFQAAANKETLEKYLPEKSRKYNDEIFEYHNKQISGPERIFRFLSAVLPVATEWDDFIYLTQLNQALALRKMLEHWRFNQRTNGAIIWQINDTYPVTSWSIIDSELMPKIAYSFVKNVFQTNAVSFMERNNNLCLFVGGENGKINGKVELQLLDAESGIFTKGTEINIQLKAGDDVQSIPVPKELIDGSSEGILFATLFDEQGSLVDRTYFTSKKWKHFKLPPAGVSFELADNSVIITADNPALFLDLYHPGTVFDNRGCIIFPGEKVKLSPVNKEVKINAEKLKVFTLNNFLCDRNEINMKIQFVSNIDN